MVSDSPAQKTSQQPARKTILVGVGAGVAAYKVGQLVRDLGREGFDVRVIPTEASLHFVGTETWRALSENPVGASVFDPMVDHIELARQAAAIVVAPATADLLAKLAGGHADDLLTTTVLASNAPMVLAPAMHTQMWGAAATQQNVRTLAQRGCRFVGPDRGALASGDTGVGRLAPISEILAATLQAASSTTTAAADPAGISASDGSLADRHLVVTAGGTREPLDPVRFLGNYSSGRQGVAIVSEALAEGAKVTLIAANLEVTPPPSPHLNVVSVETAQEMGKAVDAVLAEQPDALIMAAAVADFRPVSVAEQKLEKDPKSDAAPTLLLTRNEDILATVSKSSLRPLVLVGFGAQTGEIPEVLAKGAAKARRKSADLLVVNPVGQGRGLGTTDNEVFFFDATGTLRGQIAGTKAQVAREILARIRRLLAESSA